MSALPSRCRLLAQRLQSHLAMTNETKQKVSPAHQVINVDGGVPIRAWTNGVPFEAEARAQVERIARMPFIHRHVAVMPDVHLGKGATVGSVIATKRAIIPAAVGVDIGCGMMAVRTSLRASALPDDLRGVRTAIEAAVPHGRTDNGGPNDRGAWKDPPAANAEAWDGDAAGLRAHHREAPQARSRLAHPAPRDARNRKPLHRGLPR